MLGVPYPWATAGTPGAQSYARGVFRYSYAVDHAIHAPTEIAVPPYAYPHGYRVRVRGASVVSARRAAVLELTARRAARTVIVTVSPR